MPDTLKHKILSGLIWRGMERFGTQAISLAVSIVLARLLEPKDFGLLTLIAVFIQVSNIFVEGGFSSALIQKKTIDETDYNSIFYLGMAVAFFFYGFLFLAAPWIAAYYSEPVLVWILRLVALNLIVGAFNTIPSVRLTRDMNFKLSFAINSVSIIVSGSVGIGMAYMGYGVWALVFSGLASQAAATVVLWYLVRWRPVLLFSWSRVRELFSFGSKILAAMLSDTIFNNLYNLIIGKLFNPTILGYYSRGQSFPIAFMSSINTTIASVIFPALASCQHDVTQVRSIVSRMIKTTTFLVLPLMFGLAAVAKPFVLVLLTEKWLPCIPFLQLACITYAFWPFHVANLEAIKAMGRSDIYLTLEFIKKPLVILMILITFKFGVMAMVIGQTILCPVGAVINSWPNRRLLGYSIFRQAQDILPEFFLSAAMGGIVYGLQWIIVNNNYLLLITQIVTGIFIYLFAAKLLKLDSMDYLWKTFLIFRYPNFASASSK